MGPYHLRLILFYYPEFYCHFSFCRFLSSIDFISRKTRFIISEEVMCMAFALLMCSAVIVLCILTNRFLKRFGIPAVLIFIGLGMLFGSEGIVKIPFDNFQMAETICCTALIFIMFYGGFGTSYREAKPILPKAVLLSTVGILITAGLTGLFCYYVAGMSLQEGLLVGAVLSSTDAASVFLIIWLRCSSSFCWDFWSFRPCSFRFWEQQCLYSWD